MAGKVDLNGNGFVVTFDYNPALVMAIKQIIGRKFDPARKSWTVPIGSSEALIKLAKAFGWKATPAAIEVMKASRSMITASKAVDSQVEVSGLGGTLRPFQKAGVAYALKTERAFIADEMGLGKTVEALATIHAANAYPALVVCPASLKLNWEREAKKWLPGKRISVVNGEVKTESDVIIINYDVLKIPKKPTGKETLAVQTRMMNTAKIWNGLTTLKFQSIVFDESHYAKNYKAQRTVACKEIAKNIRIRLALTGTPVLNRPQELLSQLSILDRLDDLGGFWGFATRYCQAYKDRFGLVMGGAAHLDELNAKMRSLCYIRRNKKEVLPELPDKVRTIIPVKLTNWPEYAQAEADLRAYLLESGKSVESVDKSMQAEHLVRIEVTKQVAARGKLVAVTDWIESFLETGEKLVVFAHHHPIVEALAMKFNAPMIMGNTTMKNRQIAVDAFQTDEKTNLLVCNIQAGGVGITLTAASNVAFVELGWNPGVHDQAEDRLHRIGQKDSVNAWYFVGESTIDEVIYDLIDEKRAVVTGVTEGAEQHSISVMNELVAHITGTKTESRRIGRPNKVDPKERVGSVANKPNKPKSQLGPAELNSTEIDQIYSGLVTLYQMQTADEQSGDTTRYQNYRGFNAFDARFGSSLARQVLAGRKLSEPQLRMAAKMLIKYKKQLGG